MKYFVLDIEATAIDPSEGDILEVAMVFDDINDQMELHELEYIHFFIEPEGNNLNSLRWNPETYLWAVRNGTIERYLDTFVQRRKYTSALLSQNSDRLMHYPEPEMDFVPRDKVNQKLNSFAKTIYSLNDCTTLQIWGKNIWAYDVPWMNDKNYLKDILTDSRQVREIGELYFDPKTMDRLPSSDQCMQIANLVDKDITHNAHEDCLQEIRLIRHAFNK